MTIKLNVFQKLFQKVNECIDGAVGMTGSYESF